MHAHTRLAKIDITAKSLIKHCTEHIKLWILQKLLFFLALYFVPMKKASLFREKESRLAIFCNMCYTKTPHNFRLIGQIQFKFPGWQIVA